MITILSYKKDKVKEGSLNDIRHPKTFSWVDVFKPAKQELKQISDASGISIDDLKITLDKEERPKIIELEKHFSLIVFGAPSFEKDEITTTPVFIYASKYHNFVITFRNKDTKSISRLKESIEAKKNFFDKGSSYFIYRLLDEILNTYFTVLDNIENGIDEVEGAILDNKYAGIVEKIFKIKKTLIYFAKSLAANREVVAAIEKEYLLEIDKKRARDFRALYNEIVQLFDMSSTYREVLTGTLEVYVSGISNNLNQIMKTLTVGATFILIPTLIASIYGMNFKVLPELNWKYGYFFSLGLMALSIILMWVYFKRKKWV